MENFDEIMRDKMIMDVLASFRMDHIEVSPEVIRSSRNMMNTVQRKPVHSLNKTLSKGVKNCYDNRR